MKWTKLKQWGAGKPLGLVCLGQAVATGIEELNEVLSASVGTEVMARTQRVPMPVGWTGLYRKHWRVIGVLVECFGKGSPLADVPTGELREYYRAFRQLVRADPTTIKAEWDQLTPREREECNRTFTAAIAAFWQAHWQDLESPDVPDDDTMEAAFGKPEVVFFLRVVAPCFLLYGDCPTWLMRRARQGQSDAVEKLLWLDKWAIFDPKVAAEWQRASLRRNAYFKRLQKALSNPPGVKLPMKRLKARLAALIWRLSKLVEKYGAAWPKEIRPAPFEAPEIRALFDAVAQDLGQGLIDHHLPTDDRALYMAIRRESRIWSFMDRLV